MTCSEAHGSGDYQGMYVVNLCAVNTGNSGCPGGPNEMGKRKILIVDRDPVVTSQLAGFLEDEPYEIVTAENGAEGLEILREERIDLAVVEACVEEMDGITLLEGVRAGRIQTAMLLVTSLGTLELGEQAQKPFAMSVFDKPIDRDVFLANIRKYMPLQDMWTSRLESFLEDNYANPNLKFEDVERYFRFSKSYGYALFKKHLGESFSRSLRNVRLAKAEEVLKNTTASISEIAYLCGFGSLSTFSKAFKEKYGNNPTTYRRNWRLGQV